MEHLLSSWADATTVPALTALLLGVLTSISPCTFTTNVMALAFLGKDMRGGGRAFVGGMVYTLGRVVSYTVVGVACLALLRRGAGTFGVQRFVGQWGGYVLSPSLLLFGLFLLFGDRLRLPKFGYRAGEGAKRLRGPWGAFALGLLFALAFCPVSGVFFFGMLLPLGVVEAGGYAFPTLFGVGSSLVVVASAWLVSFSLSRLGRFYKAVGRAQRWVNIAVGALFVLAAICYFCVYYVQIFNLP